MTNHHAQAMPGTSDAWQTIAFPTARVLLALIFVLSGLSKIGAAAAIQGYMQSRGVPPALLWPTVAFEIAAGIGIAIGYQTRILAVLLAGFCLVTGAVFHNDFANQIEVTMLLKNISMAGGLLLLATVGAGSTSIDTGMSK